MPLFEEPAVEALFQAARGLPRQINRIAHYALSAAAIDGAKTAKTVGADHLQRAIEGLRLSTASRPAPRSNWSGMRSRSSGSGWSTRVPQSLGQSGGHRSFVG